MEIYPSNLDFDTITTTKVKDNICNFTADDTYVCSFSIYLDSDDEEDKGVEFFRILLSHLITE